MYTQYVPLSSFDDTNKLTPFSESGAHEITFLQSSPFDPMLFFVHSAELK